MYVTEWIMHTLTYCCLWRLSHAEPVHQSASVMVQTLLLTPWQCVPGWGCVVHTSPPPDQFIVPGFDSLWSMHFTRLCRLVHPLGHVYGPNNPDLQC